MKKSYMLEKEFQIWHLKSLIFWSKFRFWGLRWAVLASGVFLIIFRYRQTMVVGIFTQPPHHKKSSYSPEETQY